MGNNTVVPSSHLQDPELYKVKRLDDHLIRLKTKEAEVNKRKLVMVSCICFVFMGLEIAGGYFANSVAIMTDAAHMLSDVAAFMLSYFAIWVSTKQSSYKYTYGMHRAEALGALASIFFIWVLLIGLLYEAVHRLLRPEKLDGELMLITAVVGLICNIVNIFLLHGSGGHHHHHHHGHGHGHSHDHKESND